MNRQAVAWLAGVAMAATMTIFASAQAQQAKGMAGPVSVGVVSMSRQAVPQGVDLPGRAVAYEQVSIRPRVGGVVTAIGYTPGKPVAAGDPLFQLDDASYVATVAADRAALSQAEADLPIKQAAYDRTAKLVGKGYTTADLESAEADLASAKATLQSARAALDFAQTQLSWTTIRSPIAGIPEVQAVSVGDLVSAAQSDAMTTVTRLDPIYVDMLEPSARMLTIRQRIDDGALTPTKEIDARLVLEDGQTYTGKGHMVTPSSIVSTSTGTLSLRFEFENPDGKILPGMFLRGTVTLGTTQAFLVPQRATTLSATGGLTAFVVEDGKAKAVDLTYSGTQGSYWIVTGGLNEGDKLIVDGLKSLTAGREVKSVPVSIDADGLTRDAPAAAN